MSINLNSFHITFLIFGLIYCIHSTNGECMYKDLIRIQNEIS